MQLNDPVVTLKQISTRYADLLAKLGIFTVKELLTYFPRKYVDSSQTSEIIDLHTLPDIEREYLIKGKVLSYKNTYTRSKLTIQQAEVEDKSGTIICKWFNQTYLSRVMKPGKEFLLLGKLKLKGKKIEFYPTVFEPIIENREPVHLGRVTPEYSLTQGISKKMV